MPRDTDARDYYAPPNYGQSLGDYVDGQEPMRPLGAPQPQSSPGFLAEVAGFATGTLRHEVAKIGDFARRQIYDQPEQIESLMDPATRPAPPLTEDEELEIYQHQMGYPKPVIRSEEAVELRAAARMMQLMARQGEASFEGLAPEEQIADRVLLMRAQQVVEHPETATPADMTFAQDYLAESAKARIENMNEAEKVRAGVAGGPEDYAARVVELKKQGLEDEAIVNVMHSAGWKPSWLNQSFLDKLDDDAMIAHLEGDARQAMRLKEAKVSLYKHGLENIDPNVRPGDVMLDEIIRNKAAGHTPEVAFMMAGFNGYISSLRGVVRLTGALPPGSVDRDVLERYVQAASAYNPTATTSGELVGGFTDPVFLMTDIALAGLPVTKAVKAAYAGRTSARLIKEGVAPAVAKGIAERGAAKLTVEGLAVEGAAAWGKRAGLSTETAQRVGRTMWSSVAAGVAGAGATAIQVAPEDMTPAEKALAIAQGAATMGAMGGALHYGISLLGFFGRGSAKMLKKAMGRAYPNMPSDVSKAFEGALDYADKGLHGPEVAPQVEQAIGELSRVRQALGREMGSDEIRTVLRERGIDLDQLATLKVEPPAEVRAAITELDAQLQNPDLPAAQRQQVQAQWDRAQRILAEKGEPEFNPRVRQDDLDLADLQRGDILVAGETRQRVKDVSPEGVTLEDGTTVPPHMLDSRGFKVEKVGPRKGEVEAKVREQLRQAVPDDSIIQGLGELEARARAAGGLKDADLAQWRDYQEMALDRGMSLPESLSRPAGKMEGPISRFRISRWESRKAVETRRLLRRAQQPKKGIAGAKPVREMPAQLTREEALGQIKKAFGHSDEEAGAFMAMTDALADEEIARGTVKTREEFYGQTFGGAQAGGKPGEFGAPMFQRLGAVAPTGEIMAQIRKMHPSTAPAVEALMAMEPSGFVLAAVPVSKFQARDLGEGISRDKIKSYVDMPDRTAPPAVAITDLADAGKLFIADGRHRVLAAMVRQKGTKTPQTVMAYVPKAWADKNLEAGGLLFQSAADPNALGFFAKSAKVVQSKIRGPVSGHQARQTLKNAGVSADEMKWTGLDDFLDAAQKEDRKITPADLQAEIERSRAVRLEEKVKGGEAESPEMADAVRKVDQAEQELRNSVRAIDGLVLQSHEQGQLAFNIRDQSTMNTSQTAAIGAALRDLRIGATAQEHADRLNKILADPRTMTAYTEHQNAVRHRDIVHRSLGAIDTTQYRDFTLPGGGNYREILITLPQDGVDLYNKLGIETTAAEQAYRDRVREGFPGPLTAEQNVELEALEKVALQKRAEFEKARDIATSGFESSHFAERDIVVHLRTTDRAAPDGQKVMFLEEMQSDWHQAGRKKGYQTPEVPDITEPPEGAKFEQDTDDGLWKPLMPDGRWVGGKFTTESLAREGLVHYINSLKKTGVPQGPWSKTWHEMAFRRAMRRAIEGGYDAIAWTTGAQQSKRYNLGEYVNQIRVHRTESGRYVLIAHPIGGQAGARLNLGPFDAAELRRHIGDDLAGQAIEQSAAGQPWIYDATTKMNDSGMTGFYDQILPAYAEKFGKKWGMKVEDGTIQTTTHHPEARFGTQDFPEFEIGGATVHTMRLTPEARDSILKEGISLWQRGGAGGDQIQASIEFLEDGRAFLRAFEKKNVTSAFHELGHVIRRRLRDDDLAVVQKWAGVEDNVWTRQAEEKFARAWERYLRDGLAPTPVLTRVFEQLKTWFTSVYNSIRRGPLNQKITPELREVFDGLLGGGPRAAGAKITPAIRKALRPAIPRLSIKDAAGWTNAGIRNTERQAERLAASLEGDTAIVQTEGGPGERPVFWVMTRSLQDPNATPQIAHPATGGGLLATEPVGGVSKAPLGLPTPEEAKATGERLVGLQPEPESGRIAPPPMGPGTPGEVAPSSVPPVEPQAAPSGAPKAPVAPGPATAKPEPAKPARDAKGQHRLEEPPPPAVQPVRGKESVLEVPGRSAPIRIAYAVVSARDTIPSHDARQGFASNAYGDVNERNYADPTEGKNLREGVYKIRDNPNVAFLHTDTPTALDGPPIATDDLIILGGNARTMAQQLLYHEGGDRAAHLKSSVLEDARKFGIEPDSIRHIDDPMIVRVMSKADAGERGEMSRALNQSMAAPRTSDSDSVSRGRLLGQEHVSKIGAMLAGEKTLSDLFNDRRDSDNLIQTLIAGKAFDHNDLVGLTDQRGLLTQEGRRVVERTLLGAAVPDVRRLAELSPSLRNTLIRALPPIVKLRHDKALGFDAILGDALDAVHAVHESGANGLDDLMTQASMFVQPFRENPRALGLARAIFDDTPTQLVRRLARVAAIDDGANLFGKVEPESFETVFPWQGPKPNTSTLFFDAPSTRKGPGGAGTSPYTPNTLRIPGVPQGAVAFRDALRPVPMPELLRIARALGQTVRVKKIQARGMFRGRGKGLIDIHPGLFDDSESAAKTLAHEIGHGFDWLPDELLDRGNVLGRVLSLRPLIDNLGRLKVFLKDTFPLAGATNKELRQELIDLTKWWKPYDPDLVPESYRAYRESSVELYADALSVFLNSPGLLEQKAPKFYAELTKFMDRKPEVLEAYLNVQDLLAGTPEEIMAARRADVREDFGRADEVMKARAEERFRSQRPLEFVAQVLFDTAAPIIAREKAAALKGIPSAMRNSAQMALEEFAFRNNPARITMGKVQRDVYLPMLSAGIDKVDMGEYLMMTRIAAGDRQAFGNPRGHTPETAAEMLADSEKAIGPQKFGQMRALAQKYHSILFAVAEEAVEEGVYSRKAYEEILLPNAETYATFAVIDHLEDTIGAAMYKQVGTFKEIANPFDATLMKTQSLIRAIELNKAKRKVLVEGLKEWFPSEVIEHRVAPGANPPRPKPGNEMVPYMVDGKVRYLEVEEYVAKIYQSHDIGLLNKLGRALSTATYAIWHPLLVTYSPSFAVSNFKRDVGRTYRNLGALAKREGFEAPSMKEVFLAYKNASPQARARSVNRYDPLIEEMLSNRALDVPFTRYDPTESVGYDRILKEFGLDEGAGRSWLPERIGGLLKRVEAFGAYSEALPKVASYNLLTERGIEPGRRSYLVRNYVGTPNTRRRGLATNVMNALFMYSNVSLQGLRADLELGFGPRSASGFWLRSMLVDFLPKMFIKALSMGLAGAAVKAVFDMIPEYDKAGYIVIPVGTRTFDGEEKAVYFRVPHTDTERMLASTLWLLAEGETAESMAQLWGQMPISGLSPMAEMAGAWVDYAQGRNPYDDFRKRNIVSDDAWQAGGWYAARDMASWTANQFGIASTVLHWFVGEPGRKAELTTTERIVGSIPGVERLLKISDRGLDEKQWEEVDLEDRERARFKLDLPKSTRRLTSERYRLQRLRSALEADFKGKDAARLELLNAWYRDAYLPLTRYMAAAREAKDEKNYDLAKRQLDTVTQGVPR